MAGVTAATGTGSMSVPSTGPAVMLRPVNNEGMAKRPNGQCT
jgi:hypothetical protein